LFGVGGEGVGEGFGLRERETRGEEGAAGELAGFGGADGRVRKGEVG
jgi:hypothetical protein